jgi:thymidylate synthase
MKPIPGETCAQAWLAAANYLRGKADRREYNLIIEVTNPMVLTDKDKEVFSLVDSLLLKHRTSIDTVVNTIFPAKLYSTTGAEDLYKRYDAILPRIKSDPENKWGTYFLRITQRKDAAGKPFNPLLDLISKLRSQVKRNNAARAMYEMNPIDPLMDIPIYRAEKDRKLTRGGPCLSHISFKLTDDYSLMLTGFYRSQYYIARALGNLCGLAWLQHFVAEQVGLKSSRLTCIASMAQLDTTKYGTRPVMQLIDACNQVYASTEGS